MSRRQRILLGTVLGVSLLASSVPAAPASPVSARPATIEVSKKAGLGRVEVHGKIGAVLQRDEGTVAILDTSDPADPRVVGRYDSAQDSLDGDLAFSHDGRWLFYARQTRTFDEEGLHVLDVSDPKNPRLAFYLPAGGSYRVQYIKQGDAEWVLLLDAIDGMVISRFNGQTGALVPVHVDALPALKVGGPASAGLFYEPKDPATGKPLLYVTTGRTGLQIFDLTSPASPVELGSWGDVGLAEVEVVANKRSRTIYAATEYWFDDQTEPAVMVLDASKLDKVTRRGRLRLGLDPSEATYIQGMAVGGSRLYVAHSTLGVAVFDTRRQRLIPGADFRAEGARNEGAGVMGSPYAIDVELVGRSHLYVTDASLGTLTSLPR